MVRRRIVEIDQEKCNGCGACADACHEGAIGMIDGKATLLRDDYCDGLGDCLPSCPTGAISFVERDAEEYDEQAVKENMARRRAFAASADSGCPGSQPKELKTGGCPGAQVKQMQKSGCPGMQAVQLKQGGCLGKKTQEFDTAKTDVQTGATPSQLRQWPVQIQLVPTNAPYFDGADVLVAADCTAYAYADMHKDFMSDRVTLIGCPKLDPVDYTDKLTEIFANNDVQSVTMTRMQVPCCGGLERAVRLAAAASGKNIPVEVVTISAEGEIISREETQA